jgi:GntR family transcriptional regulator of vanillate catabolism
MKATTSSTEVVALLRERILAGEIRPGERLQQVPLAEELGVSRTPLREALGLLANEGLLLYEPNRGYAVRAFDLADVLAAFEVRANLESLACRVCARQGLDREELDRLAACVGEGDGILAGGRLRPADLAPYRAMNVEFHDTLMRAAGNRWIRDFVRQTHNVPLASDRIIMWDDYDIIKRSHDDHHRILAAIRERDAERAEYLMREHVHFAGLVLRRHLDRLPDGLRIAASPAA